MTADFSGRHVIVTGGSSGIGLATATAFAERGARVSLVARHADRLEEATAGMARRGATVGFAAVDVADADACAAGFAELVRAGGPCDVVVNSAGVSGPGRFLEQAPVAARRMMDVNYFGTLNVVRQVAGSMVERRSGSIVGISSLAGLMGVYGHAAYGASKFAVSGFLQALRMELAPHGVHVACCYPPDVDTPMLEAERPSTPAETLALAGNIPPLAPEDVARCIITGVVERRFELIPDVRSRAIARMYGFAPGLFRRISDRMIARSEKQVPGSSGR